MKTLKKILRKPCLIVCMIMFLTTVYQAYATTINVTSNTNWSSLSVTNGDVIVIGNNATLTVNVTNAVCGSIQIGDGTYPGILTFAGSGSPALVVTTAGGQDGTLTCGDGGSSSGNYVTMVSGATLTVNNMNDNYADGWDMSVGTLNIIIPSGTCYIPTTTYNDINITGGGTVYFSNLNSLLGTLNLGAGCTLFSYGGRWTGSGTLTGNGSIKVYLTGNANDLTRQFGMATLTLTNMVIDFEGGETVPSNVSCRDIILNSTTNFTGNVTVSDSLTVNAGFTLIPGASTVVSVGLLLGSGSINVTATGNANDLASQYSGTLSSGGGTVIFAGASAQNLGAATLNNLKINNASGVTLAGVVTTNGTITLQSGKLILGAYKLIIGSTGNITGYCSSRFIETNGSGVLEMLANHSGGTVFPVGDGFNPITITPTTDATFDVSVAGGITDYLANPITIDAANVTWTILMTSGSQNVTVTTQWAGTDELTSFDRANSFVSYRTDQAAGHPGSAWISTTGAGSASGSDPYTRTSGTITMAAGSNYFIGVGDNINPLPVSLISFNASPENNQVNLNWTTASEINNDYFGMERSIEGQTWQSIGHVLGHGNSFVTQNYMAIDNLSGILPAGTIYYRLKQVDFNGESTYSMIRSVTFGALQEKVSMYPNPANNLLNINWNKENSGSAIIKLVNSTGSTMYSENIEGTGIIRKQIDMSVYPSGIYFMQISTNKDIKSQVIYKE